MLGRKDRARDGRSIGIGAACALRFAEEGAAVVGLDLADSTEGDWARACQAARASTLLTADVRDPAALEQAVAEISREHGPVDVLVNSAGVGGGGPIHELDPAEWDRVVDINLKGTYLASRAVIPGMIEHGGGSIVNIASIEGLEGFPGGSAYNASKGGVVLLTRTMSIDYARKGLRVNAICPGFIETPLLEFAFGYDVMADVRDAIRDAHQLGRFGQPREIANAALFLASDESSFVTGVALPVDGGFTAGHRFGLPKLFGLE